MNETVETVSQAALSKCFKTRQNNRFLVAIIPKTALFSLKKTPKTSDFGSKSHQKA